ncbi:MAG: hypothetical protein WC907_08270 [Acholeplasmataceae bacterium]|jgi:hypothetical protein
MKKVDLFDLIGAKITGGGLHSGDISYIHIQLKNGEKYMIEPVCGRKLKIWDYEEPEMTTP